MNSSQYYTVLHIFVDNQVDYRPFKKYVNEKVVFHRIAEYTVAGDAASMFPSERQDEWFLYHKDRPYIFGWKMLTSIKEARRLAEWASVENHCRIVRMFDEGDDIVEESESFYSVRDLIEDTTTLRLLVDPREYPDWSWPTFSPFDGSEADFEAVLKQDRGVFHKDYKGPC